MYSFKALEIKGYRNEPVPNTLLWQERQARQVGIVLPGIGYTCQMPLLYHASQSMLVLGMDVLWVEYNYLRASNQSEVMAVEGADHSMEIQGDVESSLVILEKVTRAIQGFVSSSPAK